MSLLDKFKKSKDKSTDNHYLSNKEIKAIAKANSKVMFELEKKKYRHAEESEFITEMKDPANILEIEDLHTYFFTDQGIVKAVNGVSFEIPQGSTVGIVGESGCGKSVTSMSVMRLLQGPASSLTTLKKTKTEITFLSMRKMRTGMSFSSPFTTKKESPSLIKTEIKKTFPFRQSTRRAFTPTRWKKRYLILPRCR